MKKQAQHAPLTPILDQREEQQLFEALLRHTQSYVPGWIPGVQGPGGALLHIYARYLEVLVERINQAPDKNKLAFMDLLGINLIPAQGAQSPLVFQPLPSLGDGRVPAGSKAGAPVKGLPDPLNFETESDIALTQARLAEVVTLWPGKDAYANHSTAAIGRKPFQLFEPLPAGAARAVPQARRTFCPGRQIIRGSRIRTGHTCPRSRCKSPGNIGMAKYGVALRISSPKTRRAKASMAARAVAQRRRAPGRRLRRDQTHQSQRRQRLLDPGAP